MKRDEQVLKKAFEEQARLKKALSEGAPALTPKKKTGKAEEVPDAEVIKD